MKNKNNHSLRHQISVHTTKITSIFIAFILICSFLLISHMQYKSIQDNTEAAMQKAGSLIDRELDVYINNVINIANNHEIIRIFRKTYDDNQEEKVSTAILVTRYIEMFDNNNSGQDKVHYLIYTDNDTLYSTQYVSTLDTCPDYSELSMRGKEEADIFWIAPDDKNYILYGSIDTSPIYNSFIRVEIPKHLFSKYFYNTENNYYTLFLDSPESDEHISKYSLLNGCNLYCNINNNLKAEIYLRNLILLLFLVIICYFLIIVVVYISTDSFTKSIYNFLNRIHKSYTETMTTDDTANLCEEFYVIQEKISELVSIINKKNDSIIEIEDEKNTLELELWQAKFNPHLLYNSLSAIKWNVIKDESSDNTINLIDLLTSYYRKILNKNNLCIPLYDEIQLLKQYIQIMEYAHSQSYAFEYEICDELLQYPIIKHSLQPLVENAILHGLNQINDAKIIITGFQKNGRYYISISDNGCGMSEEKVHEILSDKYNSVYRNYGVKNTRQRLLMFFGEETFDFHVSSQINKGTTITISWG